MSGGAISTFRFHPAYYVDYIFFRRIMSRIQGAYYFRPSVEYDFLRNPNGQKFGGGAAIIWSRASEFIQTPGNKRDLGVELDVQLYYQAKDGNLPRLELGEDRSASRNLEIDEVRGIAVDEDGPAGGSDLSQG